MSRMLACAVATAAFAMALSTATPLDNYVCHDDGHFNFTKLNYTLQGPGWTAQFYNMTSQKWMTTAETNHPIWWHYMAVIIPYNLDPTIESSLLYIAGTDQSDEPPQADDGDVAAMQVLALSTKSATAIIWQVPNQPITYNDDPWNAGPRREDASIALTWWHYIRNPSRPEYVLQLPMTKSVVKAMDALELIYADLLGRNINKFILAGSSKRGWTTWLAGAVESVTKNRVIAIIPIVLDLLNVDDFLERQFTHFGGWSFALKDYYDANLTVDFRKRNAQRLWKMIDPYHYKRRLTMPKLAINAGGDQFMMPDDHRHWAKAMPADMHFLLVKNAEHTMSTGLTIMITAASAFISSVQYSWTRPVVDWHINRRTGALTFNADRAPATVDITFCDSAGGVSEGRRDFRWGAVNATPCPYEVFGACVRSIPWATLTGASSTPYLVQNSNTSFTATMPVPDGADAGKWRAFTTEITFKTPDATKDFLFTIPASVIPDTVPFRKCRGEQCKTAGIV